MWQSVNLSIHNIISKMVVHLGSTWQKKLILKSLFFLLLKVNFILFNNSSDCISWTHWYINKIIYVCHMSHKTFNPNEFRKNAIWCLPKCVPCGLFKNVSRLFYLHNEGELLVILGPLEVLYKRHPTLIMTILFNCHRIYIPLRIILTNLPLWHHCRILSAGLTPPLNPNVIFTMFNIQYNTVDCWL